MRIGIRYRYYAYRYSSTTIRVGILLVLLVLQLYYIFDSALVEVAVGGVSLSMYCVVCASRA